MWSLAATATGLGLVVFLDPAQAIRGAHLIPTFAEGRSSALLPARKSAARILNPNEEDDWLNFDGCVTCFCSFVDRDMFTRYLGQGVGHQRYGKRQEVEIEMGAEGNDESEEIDEEEIDLNIDVDDEETESVGEEDLAIESDDDGSEGSNDGRTDSDSDGYDLGYASF